MTSALSLAIAFSLAFVSALINMGIPLKEILGMLGVPGPAGGMMLLGGVIFTFWITLAYLLSGCRKFVGITTAVLIPSFCLLFSPWYGVVDPPWFGIYGIVAFLAAGAVIEVFGNLGGSKSFAVGGGLSNLTCLLITWLAIGIHTGTWVPQTFMPISLVLAFTSGAFGSLLAWLMVKKRNGSSIDF